MTSRRYTASNLPSLSQMVLREPDEPEETLGPEIERPRTRGECFGIPRPCPFITCKHHMWGDIRESEILVYGNLRPWTLQPDVSCVLDIIDQHGDRTLEEVGKAIGCTRERARQIETVAIQHLKEGIADSGMSDELLELLREVSAEVDRGVSNAFYEVGAVSIDFFALGIWSDDTVSESEAYDIIGGLQAALDGLNLDCIQVVPGVDPVHGTGDWTIKKRKRKGRSGRWESPHPWQRTRAIMPSRSSPAAQDLGLRHRPDPVRQPA